MDLHYLIYTDTEGHIRTIKIAKGANNPPEGYDLETDLYLHHYREPIADLNAFTNTKFWSFSGEAWMTRETAPNKHARWENGTWTWDSNLLLADIREERRIRLGKSDWSVLVDSPLTSAQQTEARTYRTSLRDLPSTLDMTTISSIDDIVWPTKPDFL